jgi:hypothetical protein
MALGALREEDWRYILGEGRLAEQGSSACEKDRENESYLLVHQSVTAKNCQQKPGSQWAN